jgi:GalNAc-alpha-(1->4)-GalNAc-alpha-(1->3)-diNAcBac-PP-undecaprenol alpha-1,4-N-acetyl-D-galactosaminyltransferase
MNNKINPTKKKIAFVIKTLNNKGGGAEKVLATVFNMLEKKHPEIDFELYTIDVLNEFFYPISCSEKVVLAGVKNGVFHKFRSYVFLFYYLLKKSPDYIVAFNLSAYVPLSLIAVLDHNVKLIASEHSTYDAIKSSVLKQIAFFIADRYIFKYTMLSDRVAQSFPSFVQNKYTAIANPIVVPDILLTDEIHYDSNFFNVISVGRLSKEKNHSLLIFSFAEVLKTVPNFRLYIYGDGELKSSLNNLIVSLNISDSVFLMPSTRDIGSIYKGAKLFCLPSIYEGFGLAAAEAIMLKIPVIGFKDCLGLTDFVKNDLNGILLPRTDDSSILMANAILRLFFDSDEYDRLSQGCILPSTYEPSFICEQWEKMLNI